VLGEKMKKIIILLILVFGFSISAYASEAIGAYASEAYDILKKGNQYFSSKNFDSALEQYQKAIEICVNYAEAHFNVGLVYREKGDFKRAKVSFVKAEQLYTLQNNQEKKKETKRIRRSIERTLSNRKRSGHLLMIFALLLIFSIYKMHKKQVKFSQADDVIAFFLFVIGLSVSRFSPIFQRQSLLWWCRVIISVGGCVGGLFFLVKDLYSHYKLTKKNKLSKIS